MKLPIYLDYNATTPVDPLVMETMLPWFTQRFGNAASSTHALGWEAAEAVKIARETLAHSIGADEKELIFTSGATEAINLALKGVADLYHRKGNHIITVATEHKAVLDTCAYLEKIGKEVSYLSVSSDGLIDLEELKTTMTDQTILVCVMLANNETGVIQPLKEIAEIVHEKGAILMSDATQAMGKIPVNVQELGIDLLAFSGHKFYGPKGVGGLFLRKRSPRVVVSPLFHGGGHERSFRSGTLNVPGIVGMGKAMEVGMDSLSEEMERLQRLRDQLEHALLALPATRLNGHASARLPNVSNISFQKTNGEALIMAMKDIAVSHGSACTSAVMEPSHVLSSMGLNEEDAYASVRFSLGRFTTEEEIRYTIDHVRNAVSRLREKATP